MPIAKIFNSNKTSKEAKRAFMDAFEAYEFRRAARLLATGLVDPNFELSYVPRPSNSVLNNFSGTPLFLAAEMEQNALAKALLKAGADVNGGRDGGQTPLLRAVLRGNTKMVKLFLDAGASAGLEDALESATRNVYKDITILLKAAIEKQAAAKTNKPAASQALRT